MSLRNTTDVKVGNMTVDQAADAIAATIKADSRALRAAGFSVDPYRITVEADDLDDGVLCVSVWAVRA